MNQLIKIHLKNKPVTLKTLKEAGLISEGQSLPGRLVDASAIDHIQRLLAALGHNESIEKSFSRHLAMVTKELEPSSLEDFFTPECKAWVEQYFSLIFGDDAKKFRTIERARNGSIKSHRKHFLEKAKERKYLGG